MAGSAFPTACSSVSCRLYGSFSASIVFFTAGPSEARAWLVPRGATAWHAAGRVHSDFQQRFVRAEVTACRAFTARPQAAPELKGRDYEVRDGDVLRFRAG